jgi:hypothetical protein
MLQPAIERWEKIFLDTSVIIGVLAAIRGTDNENYNFCHRLIKELSKDKSADGKERIFYISAITLSEILIKIQPGSTLHGIIVQALNSSNTDFVAFDEVIAEIFIREYHSILGNEELNKFAKSIGWPEHDLHTGREWVTRDVMIIASATERKADVLLTLDKKTMYPLSVKLNVPCAVCFPAHFNYSGKHIFTYEETSIEH